MREGEAPTPGPPSGGGRARRLAVWVDCPTAEAEAVLDTRPRPAAGGESVILETADGGLRSVAAARA